MNIVHDDHSHVGALTEGGNHDVMVCKVRCQIIGARRFPNDDARVCSEFTSAFSGIMDIAGPAAGLASLSGGSRAVTKSRQSSAPR
jgi:hypothetical protein